MKKLLYVGMDVHKESIVMACASEGGSKGTWHRSEHLHRSFHEKLATK